MVTSKLLDPLKISLDMNNPRFSLFQFENEEDIIDYLVQYEDIKSLALQIINNGYISLGERIIVSEYKKDKVLRHTVLEGNRRIAALKIIFTQTDRFTRSERDKISSLDKNDFLVNCDVINETERNSALFKITSKHIEGIKQWSATDKRIFYGNLFEKYKTQGKTSTEALNDIGKVTPESIAKVRNSLKKLHFLSQVHQAVKKTNPELNELSHLDTDVLTSRVYNRIRSDLNLKQDENFYLIAKNGKENEFEKILNTLGKAAWISKTLDTRSFSKQEMWTKILNDNVIVPNLDELIQSYLKSTSNMQVSPDSSSLQSPTLEDWPDTVKEINPESNSQITPLVDGNSDSNSESNIPKYRLFIVENTLNVSTNEYNLLNNIKILDDQSEEISNKSSLYSNVLFECANDNIAIKENKILPLSENGIYSIKVKFHSAEKFFSLVLNIPQKKKKKEIKNLFTSKWHHESTALLSSKEEYSNIVSVLNRLDDNKDISINSDNFVVIALLIRILIEYTSKAYWEKFRDDQRMPKDLPQIVSLISTHLFNTKIIGKETKKSFANGSDLETLNGQIHDYKSNISSITLETIFKSYQSYLDILFAELNKHNS